MTEAHDPADPAPRVLRAAPPSLAGLVHRISAYEADAPGDAVDLEPASFAIPIVLSFGAPFRIAFDRCPGPGDGIGSFVSGLHAGHVVIGYGGPVSCVQIDLTPLGARLFFGNPLSDFATRLVPLTDVADPDLGALRERLGDTMALAERLRIAARFMERRLLGRSVDPEMAFVWQALHETHGTVRIDRLAESLGWSRKRLARDVRAAFGLAPKRLARIARFRHAMTLARSAAVTDWAGLAADCGYADQAHLVREFGDFAGRPPEQWRRGAGHPPAEQIFNTEAGREA